MRTPAVQSTVHRLLGYANSPVQTSVHVCVHVYTGPQKRLKHGGAY